MSAEYTSTLPHINVGTIGHVDHGKSTVIGRLLADTDSLPEGKLEQVKKVCELNSKPFEYAFLLDALKDEQAQGITIDMARCFFHTDKRHYIIIDAPPSLGLLTINVLMASHSILIPIQCEYYALEGLSQLLNTIRLIQKHKKKSIKKDLEIEGILITMFDNRLNLSRQVVKEVSDYFGDKVYKTYINRNVRLGEAPSHGKPILLYDATSVGAQNYMSLASEILNSNV